MNLDLKSKVAFVSGSSKGIGLSIAQVLHAEGCKVILNGRNAKDLKGAASLLPGSIAVGGDMSLPEEADRIIAQAISTVGDIDILVCNIGSGKSMFPGQETLDEWHRMLTINLVCTINAVNSSRSSLLLTKGSIVCISSICSLEAIKGAPIAYSASKAALNSYVRGMAIELGKKSVRINAIAAGNINFEGSVWQEKLIRNKNAVGEMLEKDVALGCLGSPSDVSNLAAYLSSPVAKFVTGAIWTVDGGQIKS